MRYAEIQRSLAAATDGWTNNFRSPVFSLVAFLDRTHCAHVPRPICISVFSMGRYSHIDRMRLHRFYGHSQFIALDPFELEPSCPSPADWLFRKEYMDFDVSKWCYCIVWSSAYRLQCFVSFNFQPKRTIVLPVGHNSTGDQFKNAALDPFECPENRQIRAICACNQLIWCRRRQSKTFAISSECLIQFAQSLDGRWQSSLWANWRSFYLRYIFLLFLWRCCCRCCLNRFE